MWCCCKPRPPIVREIKLVCVGVDSVGKTAVVKTIKGEDFRDVLPTNGFSVIEFPYNTNFHIKVFDLGGGERIRDIWTNYYAEVHGIIFVVDLTDTNRQEETYQCIRDCIENRDTFGKPFLFVMNNVSGGDVEDVDFCLTANLHEICERNRQFPFVTHLRKMILWKSVGHNKKVIQRAKLQPIPLLQQFCDFVEKIIEQYVAISEGVRQAEVRLRIRQQEAREARKLRLMQMEHEQRKSEISLMEGYTVYTIPRRNTGDADANSIIEEEIPVQDMNSDRDARKDSLPSSGTTTLVKPARQNTQIMEPSLLKSEPPTPSDTVVSSIGDGTSALSSDVFEPEQQQRPNSTAALTAQENQPKKVPHNKIVPINEETSTSTSQQVDLERIQPNGIISGKRYSSRMDRIKLALANQSAMRKDLAT